MSRSGTISIRSLFTIEWMISFVVDYACWWCLVSSSDQVREHTELLCCSQLWHTVGTSSYCSALVKLLYSGQHNSDTSNTLIDISTIRAENQYSVGVYNPSCFSTKKVQTAGPDQSLWTTTIQRPKTDEKHVCCIAVCLLASNGGLI